MIRKSILYLLSVIIFEQSALFGSGLYAYFLHSQAVYCSCNHSSKKEIHSTHRQNQEDRNFNGNARIKADVAENIRNIPDCHAAKTGEVHFCACKKTKKSFEIIYSQFSPSYIFTPENSFIYAEILYADLLSQKATMTGSLHDPRLIKPPRFSLS